MWPNIKIRCSFKVKSFESRYLYTCNFYRNLLFIQIFVKEQSYVCFDFEEKIFGLKLSELNGHDLQWHTLAFAIFCHFYPNSNFNKVHIINLLVKCSLKQNILLSMGCKIKRKMLIVEIFTKGLKALCLKPETGH